MSQQDLADRIGVSRQTINAIELEKYVPSATVIMKISFVFGKSVDEVFQLEDKDWK
ncbi:MAG: helix-turn-helix transcriptional regulator [Bacteroidales bacterium]|nr:helix-turn-helix transcriptional regulator [Bacteroidales bacterium]